MLDLCLIAVFGSFITHIVDHGHVLEFQLVGYSENYLTNRLFRSIIQTDYELNTRLLHVRNLKAFVI